MNNRQTSLIGKAEFVKSQTPNPPPPPYNYPWTPISFLFFFFVREQIKIILQESPNLVAVLGHVHSVPDDFSTG